MRLDEECGSKEAVLPPPFPAPAFLPQDQAASLPAGLTTCLQEPYDGSAPRASGRPLADDARNGDTISRVNPIAEAGRGRAGESSSSPIDAQACLGGADVVTQLALQSYIALNVAPVYGQSPETLGPGHVFKAYTGSLLQSSSAAETAWLAKLPKLEELTLRAFRYALKIAVDCAAMAEDAADMEDKELEAELRTLDSEWHLGVEGSLAWQVAMEQGLPYLMAMRKPSSNSAFQAVRLRLSQDKVRVAELRSEVVQSIWASASLELRYCTNDDDERYSIQAHPTLLRNMIVQSAEYPIYTSPPTTIWL